jgi:(p)ppGpp synthase/HD superfamily hydrolase
MLRPDNGNFIKAARQLGYAIHKDQLDKIRKPYRHHLDAVAAGVRVLGGSDHAFAAAYLHDSVEDHPLLVSFGKLLNYGFPGEVVRLIDAVTKIKGERQSERLDKIVAAGPDAQRLKLADLLHNTRHDRLAEVVRMYGQSEKNRLLAKYQPSIARLMKELELISESEPAYTQPRNSQGPSFARKASMRADDVHVTGCILPSTHHGSCSLSKAEHKSYYGSIMHAGDYDACKICPQDVASKK